MAVPQNTFDSLYRPYQVRVREPVAKIKHEKSRDAARPDRLISVIRATNTMPYLFEWSLGRFKVKKYGKILIA